MTFIPLSGLETEVGPVVGALLAGDSGPLLVLHVKDGRVRPIQVGDGPAVDPRAAAEARARQTQAPVEYALANASGQPGRACFDLIEAHCYAMWGPSTGRIVVAVQGGEVRALNQEERARILSFTNNITLPN